LRDFESSKVEPEGGEIPARAPDSPPLDSAPEVASDPDAASVPEVVSLLELPQPAAPSTAIRQIAIASARLRPCLPVNFALLPPDNPARSCCGGRR